MKRIKRIILILLVLTFVLAAFAGCTSKPDQETAEPKLPEMITSEAGELTPEKTDQGVPDPTNGNTNPAQPLPPGQPDGTQNSTPATQTPDLGEEETEEEVVSEYVVDISDNFGVGGN